MIKNIFIRVDANSTIGLGHLVRCEILSDELAKREKINITFICKWIPDSYKSKLLQKQYKVLQIPTSKPELSTLLTIIPHYESILIIDSDISEFYTPEFQKSIRLNHIKLMMITFYHQYHFYADFVLNQNIMALSQTYLHESYTKLFLGPSYVILKDVYRNLQNKISPKKLFPKQKTVLISFGGVDKPDRTAFVYKALDKLTNPPNKIIIVLGSLYGNRKNIEKLISESKIPTELYQNTSKMPELQAEANILISSGGLTVWEAGCLKTLNIVMGYSEREKIGGKFLHDNNYGYYLGSKDDYTIDSLAKVLDNIIQTDYKEIVENLYQKIDVNGVKKISDSLLNEK